ncbi:GLIPR1-like protein 1 [Patiria miniata]|uniref:SCP domain-containing protein n=1 Tax=Patiria miniata TaxID=46514 RepID=A0A914BNU5_PATMI|nr:GLIPR1-like protein 1 [Patiria miniata]
MYTRRVLMLVLLILGPANAQMTKPEFKEYILQYINDLRRNVDPEAADMPKLSWDDDLEARAQYWADTCSYNYRGATTLPDKPHLGRIYEIKTSSQSTDPGVALGYLEEDKQYKDFGPDSCLSCDEYLKVSARLFEDG